MSTTPDKSDIDTWGPAGWTFLHAVTLGFPAHPTAAECAAFRRFFEVVGEILPCQRCKEHYRDQIHKDPPPVDSRQRLVQWLIRIHNGVRESQGKPTISQARATRIVSGTPRRIRIVRIRVFAGFIAIGSFAVLVSGMILFIRRR